MRPSPLMQSRFRDFLLEFFLEGFFFFFLWRLKLVQSCCWVGFGWVWPTIKPFIIQNFAIKMREGNASGAFDFFCGRLYKSETQFVDSVMDRIIITKCIEEVFLFS